MIGAIENGASSVSTSTLDRIGVAMSVSLSELVADPARPRVRAQRRLGWKGRRGGTGTLLSSVPASREVETWEWRLASGERYRAGADPLGWRVQLIVVAGTVTLTMAGKSRRLGVGSHVFDSDRAHDFANEGAEPAHFFRLTIC